MYKVVWITRFAPGLDKDEADQRWSEAYGPLAAQLPGLESYVQNRATSALGLTGTSEAELSFDGYACGWFQNQAAFVAASQTPEWQSVLDEAATLLDVDRLSSMSAAVEERTIIEGDCRPFKTVWIVRFKPAIERDDARNYWTGTHGPFARDVPGIDRYVQNHVVATTGTKQADRAALDAVGFDGFSECWFQDRAAFERALTSPEWHLMNEDAHNLFDVTAFVPAMSAVLDERVLKG